MANRRAMNLVQVNPVAHDMMFKFPMLGMDETGTSSIAGPIAAGGVVLPQDAAVLEHLQKAGVRDCKRISSSRTQSLAETIKKAALFHWVHSVPPDYVDRVGVERATNECYRKVYLKALEELDDLGSVAIDGLKRFGLTFFHIAVAQGDIHSLTIAAASILAKASRDAVMSSEYEDLYPGYGFFENKGYASEFHKAQLVKLGVSEAHRKTSKPVAALLAANPESQNP